MPRPRGLLLASFSFAAALVLSLPTTASAQALAGAARSASGSATAPTQLEGNPLVALLLDYHAPIEHDVLLSHLCVDRCTAQTGCPASWIAAGVDWHGQDLAVFRPEYLGQSARFVVQAFGDTPIDFLSISGHHASGFSGEMGRGSFHTETLGDEVEGLREIDGFFAQPSTVMLQGCWTDVKSSFDGDPIEYVRHIIEDTQVRAGESERLLAAVQQIAGDEQAYRDLFPNACILGYQGTQVPGGLAEIYAQTQAYLRGLAAGQGRAIGPPKFDYRTARRSRDAMQELVRGVDRECSPRGWPCNLCRADAGTYRPLATALIQELRRERARIHLRGESRSPREALARERAHEASSAYANVSWSCSAVPTDTAPVFPEPIDRAPYAELFLNLLRVDLGAIQAGTRQRLEAELVHLLGSTTLPEATRARLRQQVESPEGVAWRRAFYKGNFSTFSTFRQRDFFDFLAEIGCVQCLSEALAPHQDRVLRENAASQLRPHLGRAVYERALADPSARVRWLAAERLEPELGNDLIRRAAADPDDRVRDAVQEKFGDVEPSVSEARAPAIAP